MALLVTDVGMDRQLGVEQDACDLMSEAPARTSAHVTAMTALDRSPLYSSASDLPDQAPCPCGSFSRTSAGRSSRVRSGVSSPSSAPLAFLRPVALDPPEVTEFVDAVRVVLGAASQDGHAAIALLLGVGPIDRAWQAKDAVAIPAVIAGKIVRKPTVARLDLGGILDRLGERPVQIQPAAACDDHRRRRHVSIQSAAQIVIAVEIGPEVVGPRNVVLRGLLAQRTGRFGRHQVDVPGRVLPLDPGAAASALKNVSVVAGPSGVIAVNTQGPPGRSSSRKAIAASGSGLRWAYQSTTLRYIVSITDRCLGVAPTCHPGPGLSERSPPPRQSDPWIDRR